MNCKIAVRQCRREKAGSNEKVEISYIYLFNGVHNKAWNDILRKKKQTDLSVLLTSQAELWTNTCRTERTRGGY